MALTNATIDGAFTLQSSNNALEGRLFVGGYWSQANPQSTSLAPMAVWRQGVVPSSSFSNNFYDLIVAALATPSLSMVVYPGTFIVSRASQAVYQGYNSAVQTVTVSTADPTNPRLDLIVARVEDTGVGDSNLRAQIQVITGTPAAIPVIPAVPTGAIPLASARVNALATTITTGQITDLRKSVAVNGAVRRLLVGDLLSDVGFHDGELRDTGTTLDRWSDATSSWKNLLVFSKPSAVTYYDTPTPTGSGATGSFTGVANTVYALASIAVADPGFPYKIRGTAGIRCESVSSSLAYASHAGAIYVDGGGTTFPNPSAAQDASTITTAFLETQGPLTPPVVAFLNLPRRRGTTTYTGTHTVYFLFKPGVQGTATWGPLNARADYYFELEIIPA